MTCVAGYTDGQTLSLMGDSVAFMGDCEPAQIATPKVWTCGTALLGVAGSLRFLQVARHYWPDLPLSGIDPGGQIISWLSEVRDVCQARGVVQVTDGEVHLARDCRLLVGYGRRFYEIDRYFGAVDHVRPYTAIGCGADAAIAALWVQDAFTSLVPRTAEQRLTLALEAAAAHNVHVRPPYTLVTRPCV